MSELISGPAIGFEVISSDAVEKLVLCTTQSPKCREYEGMENLVSLFEKDEIRNGVFCSQTDADAKRVGNI